MKKVSALVASEIKISDLKNGVLYKPKMSHFPFVNSSSRSSISILMRKLCVDNFTIYILIYVFVSVFPKHIIVSYLELGIWKRQI